MIPALRKLLNECAPATEPAARVTEDEHGVVSVYGKHGVLTMFMNRREWDQIRASMAMPPMQPERVVSGGSIVYGIERSES